MKDLQNFDKMTIREILTGYLGEEKADILIQAILQGIKEGKKGDELKNFIYETLCRLSVTKIEVFEVLMIMRQVNPKQVNP
jgi:uncharacterized membrane-anchored protein YjiN (DUF445 family)